MMWGLVVNIAREHRIANIGLLVCTVAASALVVSSALVLAAAQAGDGVPAAGTPRAQTMTQIALENAQYTAGLTAGIAFFAAVFLTVSTVGFAVQGRRAELATFRLVGADPRQARSLVVRESGLVALLASVLGGILAVALVRPYAFLLVSLDIAPAGFSPHLRTTPIVWGLIGVLLASVIGAAMAARKTADVKPIEALREAAQVRKLGRGRLVFGLLCSAGAIAMLLMPVTVGEFQSVTIGLGGLSVLALTALAPVVMPVVARMVGGLASVLSPGPGLVAREQSAFGRERTAALGNPIVLLICLGGTLFMLAQTGQAAGFLDQQDAIHAEAIVSGGDAHSVSDAAGRLGASAVPLRTSNQWAMADDPNDPPQVAWTEPQSLASVTDVDVVHGSMANVHGTQVATTRSDWRVGQHVRLIDGNNRPVDVTIAAVLAQTTFLNQDVIGDVNSLPTGGHTSQLWFVTDGSVGAAQTIDRLSAALPSAHVMSVRQWLDTKISAARSSQTQGILSMIGGGAVLALVAMGQTIMTSLRERRAELRRLQTLGARRRAVIASAVTEVAVSVAGAVLLSAVVMAVVYLRMSQYLRYQQIPLTPSIPVGALAGMVAISVVVALVCACVGAIWAMGRGAQGSRAVRFAG